WFQMGATHKVKLENKHTAEFNYDEGLRLAADRDYERQVVARIGLEEEEVIFEEKGNSDLISIVVPVYNAADYLRRCLDS
ncbi:glycosyl transferase, partial [Streptococcus danieliae]|nr:glycosyl transferase [Streptococcus danieliae]